MERSQEKGWWIPGHPLLSPHLRKRQLLWNSSCPHPGVPLVRTKASPLSIKKAYCKMLMRALLDCFFWVAKKVCVYHGQEQIYNFKKILGSRQSLAGSRSFQATTVRYLTEDVWCYLLPSTSKSVLLSGQIHTGGALFVTTKHVLLEFMKSLMWLFQREMSEHPEGFLSVFFF